MKNITVISALLVLAIFITGCATTGQVVADLPVIANSCNKDDKCEMNSASVGTIEIKDGRVSTAPGSGTILSLSSDSRRVSIDNTLKVGSMIFNDKGITTEHNSSLRLTSDNKQVVVDGTLNAGNVRISGRTISTMPGRGQLTLASDSGDVLVNGGLSIGTILVKGSRISSTNALTLASGAQKIIVEGILYVGNTRVSDKGLTTTKGALSLTSANKAVNVDGTITSTSLKGSGNAYACIDANGKLFRSNKPCV
jgi:hypothetical protein